MLGRQVLLRLRGPIRLSSTNNLSSQQHTRATWSILSQTQRFYATPGRPRSTVGEPSRTVKRDIKRKARTTTAKGAAKKPAKKPAAKKKKKAAKPKPKPKPKPKKKQLTEAQKEAKKAQTERAKITALKTVALKAPPKRAVSSWVFFLAQKTRGSASEFLAGRTAQIAAEFKALSPAEVEHYNHLTVQENQKRLADYETWLRSYSVEDIVAANAARRQLRRKSGQRTKYPTIEDPRLPSRPVSGYNLFVKERQGSGDMKNISAQDRMRLVGQEWRAMSESEKSSYDDRDKAN